MDPLMPGQDEQDVLVVARAWQAGRLDLAGVRAATSGRERAQALRLASRDERALLEALIEALVADDRSGQMTERGWMCAT